MIPISDINPARNTPVVSRIFMVLAVLIYFLIQPKDINSLFNFFYQYAAIPCELNNMSPLSELQFYYNDCKIVSNEYIFQNKNLYFSVIVSNLLHANFVHLIGNLWSFWIFGNNVEDKLGKFMFITFLISTAFFSVFSHTILNLNSITPIVGASGIVSGLMGAYVYLFPNAKLLVLVPLGFLFPTTIKAKYFMIFWFVSQVFLSFGTQNISWEAHLGGFVFGYVILRLFNYRRYRL
jgi:membrane associated rhomboid family serine protease